jgi:elongation factor 1-alpha
MSADRAALRAALERGESDGGAVEFKERLTREVHLRAGRFESLAAQLRHRVLSGDGRAEYVLGVTDAGGLAGIDAAAFEETVAVLRLLADEAGAEVQTVQTWVVGIAEVTEAPQVHRDESHIVIGTAGHVDHGKSTLVGSLVTGAPDDGQGATRRFLDVQPHEVERGLSADLSYAVYGHGAGGPIHLRNPHRKDERAEVVRAADRVVSFVDTVGHEPWLRTTIRGLVGQRLDYGLLVVAADDGPTRTTREHLGILLAMELPTVVAITKTDMVTDAQTAEVVGAVEGLLRQVGRTPLEVARYGVDAAVTEIDETVVPIVATSAMCSMSCSAGCPSGRGRRRRRSACTSTARTRSPASARSRRGRSPPARSARVMRSCSGRWPTGATGRWRCARSSSTTTASTARPPAASSASRSRG